ncbi:hybrid sensor histidine kinase/response regulator [Thalassobius sp. Cn5-15]|nr:hybrid sensor histidine kinase/response regulator [Thalassobius sp. Cn5-15]
MLQEPQVSATRARLDQNFPLLFLVLVGFTALMCFINCDKRTLVSTLDFTLVRNLPHPATILLLVGFTLFSPNKRGYFAASFVLVHLGSCYWGFQQGTFQTAAFDPLEFTLISLIINAIFGIATSALVRRLEPLLSRGRFKPALDVSLSATMFLTLLGVGTLYAGVLGWVAIDQFGYGTSSITDIALLGLSQAIMVAIFTPMLLVLSIYPLKMPDLPKLLPVLAMFLLLGLLDKSLGWQTERVFTVMFAILLRFLLPVTTALQMTLAGFILQRLALPDETLNAAEDYLIFATFLALLTLFDLILFNQRARVLRSRALRHKLWNSYEFSKFGRFLFNARLQRFWMDDIIQMAPQRTFNATLEETLRRMPRKDAERLHQILSNHSPEPQAAIIRIADGPQWSESAPYHVYRLHCVSETSWQYGLVTIGTLTDITELHTTSTTLRETLRQLEANKERQHRLFALISHELRTPAALLKMLAEQMNDTQDWDNLGPRFDSVLQQFLSLMDDMGSVVRDEELLPASEGRFNPAEVLQHLSEVYRCTAEASSISIRIACDLEDEQDRILDVGRLHQVLGNLIRNAILHSEAHTLTISYSEEDNGGQLQGRWVIEDDGKGIPPALLPGLFSPFNRKTHGVHSEAEGSGMGTYIVKLFVDKMGGRVSYCPAQGGGARFEVKLPIQKAAPAAPVAPKPAELEKIAKTILLVEDNPLVAEITQSQLLRRFETVHHLASAEAALQRLHDLAPDMILTDVELPGMDGVALSQALRQAGFDGPLFGLTAGATSRDDILTRGANGILAKPLSIRHLLYELSSFEGWQAAQDQLAADPIQISKSA